MKILLTAFENFGGDDFNTSKIIAEKLNYDYLILPVTLSSFDILEKYINNNHYDYIILLGMAKSRNKISIEDTAINLLDYSIPDNDNLMIKQKPIIDNFDTYLHPNINLSDLPNNPSYYISHDAGTYICNYLYYKTLALIKTKSIFIHIPGIINDDTASIVNDIIKFITK